MHPLVVHNISAAKVGKGAAAGALGGFIGGGAMLAYGALFDYLFDRNAKRRNRPRKFLPTADQELDGTAVLGYAAGLAVGHELKGAALVNAARAMHFLFAAGLGAVYGAMAEITPATTMGYGMAFAAAEELSGNEWLMPRVGFLRPVGEYPVHERVHSLTSHLLWGAVTECVRRRVR